MFKFFISKCLFLYKKMVEIASEYILSVFKLIRLLNILPADTLEKCKIKMN